MEKLLIHRTADINETLNDYVSVRAELAKHESDNDAK